MTDPTPDVPTLRRLLAEGLCLCSSASTDWDGVAGLLDRLEAAEEAVVRVEALDFESVIDEHFVMWHEMGGNDEPPGEWRCQCGLKFGFSHTAVQHVATALRAALAEVTP